ncbi:hypothetical protein ACVRXQ_06610 [Streptococcus panodentis]|uniref:Lipoprotein n=1 Tax=Streptococcus panodentis TaxID=1581472 RepID=A0ABS5AV76_9STRE|nr:MULTISPECIES: hypothetical protein [Streptococcus]KXT83148.1 hypothetical protein STRDD11_01656 [Streptococcus sp. DD11]MBP2620472.1 hypothetical protein [Streptococcus panodentis]
MKKQYISFIIAIAVALSLVFLSACNAAKNPSNGGGDSSSGTQKAEEGIYEHLKNAKDKIWYLTDEVSKDSYPLAVYVFNKGKVKGYTTFNRDEGKSFGDLAKMTDEEIIEYYEEQEGTFLKHIYDVTASNAEQFPNDSQYKELAEALQPYGDGKGQLPTADFQVKLVTNDTGEGVATEDIEIDFLDISKPDRNFGNFWNYTLKLKHVTSTSKVYNSTYNGFETEDDVQPLFITRSKSQFQLDTLKTKGIEVE